MYLKRQAATTRDLTGCVREGGRHRGERDGKRQWEEREGKTLGSSPDVKSKMPGVYAARLSLNAKAAS